MSKFIASDCATTLAGNPAEKKKKQMSIISSQSTSPDHIMSKKSDH